MKVIQGEPRSLKGVCVLTLAEEGFGPLTYYRNQLGIQSEQDAYEANRVDQVCDLDVPAEGEFSLGMIPRRALREEDDAPVTVGQIMDYFELWLRRKASVVERFEEATLYFAFDIPGRTAVFEQAYARVIERMEAGGFPQPKTLYYN